jgi:hypothetical protein
MGERKLYYLDLLERVLWTFLQGFAAAWVILGDLSVDSLAVGVVAGLVALAKGIAAKTIGSPESAATLPSPPDRPYPEETP